jgi:hypothetical protein
VKSDERKIYTKKSQRDDRIIEVKNEKFIQKNPEGMTGL